MKVVLMHGKDTNPGEKWYPWLQEQMRIRNIEYIAPTLPQPENPRIDEWLNELQKTHPDKETILIGHSRGGVTIMRYLEILPEGEKVKKVILIATNSGSAKKVVIPAESNFGFFTESGYDFKNIKTHCDDFVIFHSRDDKWVPLEAGEENTKGLGARFLAFNDRCHFGKNLKEIPELLREIV